MVDVGHVRSRLETELTGAVTSSDTDFPVLSTARFTAPMPVLVGHKDAWHDPTQDYVPEILLVTKVVDGTTLRTTLPNRGISGTAVRSHDGTTGDLVVTAVLDEWHWDRLRDGLAGVAKIVMDTYNGDGGTNRTVPLPFTPGFVAVSWGSDPAYSAYSGAMLGASVRGLLAGGVAGNGGSTPTATSSAGLRPRLAAAGFIVSGASTAQLNAVGVTYAYTAIGA